MSNKTNLFIEKEFSTCDKLSYLIFSYTKTDHF